MTTTIAFVCGAVLTVVAEGLLSRLRGRAWPAAEPARAVPDEPADPGRLLRPAGTSGTGTPDTGTRNVWREHCVQYQLSEHYVAAQTQEIIGEYSALMEMALTEAMSRTQTLQSVTGSASDLSGEVQGIAQAASTEAAEAETLLHALIGSLVKVEEMADFISTVASRTNLLSLNATIEAARAGDAGRGFAVVAHEVKELATATANSTTRITETVEELRQEARAVLTALAKMTSEVEGMDRAATRVVEVMVEQRVALDDLDVHVNTVSSQTGLLPMLIASIDRRKHDRVVGQGTVVLDIGDRRIESSMLDLSPGGLGCSVLRSVPGEVGSRVTVTMPLPRGDLRVDAVVRRRTEGQGRDHLGLEFLALTGDQATAVQQYLEHLTSSTECDDVEDDAGDDADLVPALAS